MEHKLPNLTYAYEALEPHIDARTMEIHHTKHHAGYVAKLNAALNKYPDVAQGPLEDLLRDISALPEDIQMAVKNNGGGHYNHSLFWSVMTPDGSRKPSVKLAQSIDAEFGNFDEFKKLFAHAAGTRFGSGWAWLIVDRDKKLSITSTANQNTPLESGKPILGLDVWEHAYYLKYQNRRPDYITAWWNVVNWERVEENFSATNA